MTDTCEPCKKSSENILVDVFKGIDLGVREQEYVAVIWEAVGRIGRHEIEGEVYRKDAFDRLASLRRDMH